MENITIGQSVKIKRTDGRVHAAVVSKLNNSAKSITVEWYERGETKGKEVELDAILALNPEILQDLTEQHAAPEPKKQATAPVSLSRNPTHSAIGGANRSTNRMTMHSVGTAGSGGGGGIATSGGGIGASSSVSSVLNEILESNTSAANSQASATTGIMRPRNSHATTAGVATGTRIASAVNTNTSTMSGIGGGNTNSTTAERSTAGGNNTANNTANTTGGSNVGARRSYVVKEVERLKENREKRRARQAEIKEEKVALMNQDPGNPNWETAQMIREYQNTLEFYPLIDGQVVEDHQITVCVRKRPLSRKEVGRKEIDVISVPRKDMLIVHEPRNKVDLTKFLEHHKFRFDYAFNEQCDNAMVYKYTAKPLVKTIFDGGMATCFAYGQTGSGKTHTMGGEFNGKVQDCKNGIYAMAAKDVFVLLNNPRYRSLNLVVSASFFEIYSGKVFDLLADKQKLRVLEDGKQQVQVVGLTEKVVDSVEEVLKLIQHGNNARTSGQTSANSNSSRSHAVFQIVLRPPGSAKIHGKFSFIDLAGNERGADTSSANRQTRMEGAEINKSLLALKECIRALGKQSSHLPFRVSKLTQVLRDSFIGEKSKTCMIAMISPGLSSCEHTLNTLRYADRVKELVVKETHDVLREEEEIMEEEDEEDEEVENVGLQQQQLQQNTQLSSQGQQQHRGSVGGLGMQHNNHHNSHHHHNNNNNNNKNGPPTEMDLALLRSLSKSHLPSGTAKPNSSDALKTYRRSGGGGSSNVKGNSKVVTDINQFAKHVDNDSNNNNNNDDDAAAGGGDERECGGADKKQMKVVDKKTLSMFNQFIKKIKEYEVARAERVPQQEEQSQWDFEHDMSDELLVQHAAINDLQQTEEMVVDQHRTINDFLEQFLSESKSLYDLTNYVDYDQDAYCKRGEAMFTQLVDIAVTCRDMMADYRAKLAKEEMLSCNFKPPNKR